MELAIPTNVGIFFDTETIGIPNWKIPSEDESQPHMTQLAAILANLDTKEIIQTIDLTIQTDGQWEIPQVCVDLNGVSNEYADAVGIPEPLALNVFLAMWRRANKRIAHNTTFDNRIIRIATKRYQTIDVQDEWHEGEYSCTGLLSKPIMKMGKRGKYGYKMPKLSEAYEHFTGKELENAHTAMADTKACMDVYFKIKELDQSGEEIPLI